MGNPNSISIHDQNDLSANKLLQTLIEKIRWLNVNRSDFFILLVGTETQTVYLKFIDNSKSVTRVLKKSDRNSKT